MLYEMTYMDSNDDDFPEKMAYVEADHITQAIEKLGDSLYDPKAPDAMDKIELVSAVRVHEGQVIR